MDDVTTINQRTREINSLYSQRSVYQQAIDLANSKITAFVLTGGDEMDESRIEVSAEGIATPPQMLDAIKTQVAARIADINKQLTDLGVSPSAPAAARKK